jgi:hypothetical protein
MRIVDSPQISTPPAVQAHDVTSDQDAPATNGVDMHDFAPIRTASGVAAVLDYLDRVSDHPFSRDYILSFMADDLDLDYGLCIPQSPAVDAASRLVYHEGTSPSALPAAPSNDSIRERTIAGCCGDITLRSERDFGAA